MSRRRLLFEGSKALVLLVFSLLTCRAQQNNNCSSSCGNVRNITYPFRLLYSDPSNCGEPGYELACENNRPMINLGVSRYFVEAINYDNFSIRVVYAGYKKDNCSSFSPEYQSFAYQYYPYYPYYLWYDSRFRSRENTAVIFISCTAPANSTRYMDTICSKNTSSNASLQDDHSYVVIGDTMKVSDLEVSCGIDGVAWASSRGPIKHTNSSTSINLDGLLYGFELFWFGTNCSKCGGDNCYVDKHYKVRCRSLSFRDFLRQVGPEVKYFFRLVAEEVVRLRYFIRDMRAASRGYYSIPVSRIIMDSYFLYPAFMVAIMGLFLATRFLCCCPCVSTLLIYKLRRRHLSLYDSIENFLQSHNNLMPIRYSYSDIKKMTKNFKDKLGEGGYGSVYKGKLRSGSIVAIKILGKSNTNGQDFINEVATIGRIHHVNVVQLIGYCAERSKRALVYDFMPNGSLEKYAFSREGNKSISCEKMYEISLGVAHGMDYLHEGCDMQILHFDIKPHNILLDENFTPKISDFGLAKLYSADVSIVSLTAARGTIGYMAPELFYRNIGGVSYKADVYSFGMLLLEMTGKKNNVNACTDHSSEYFPSWVYHQLSEEKYVETVEATEEEREMVKKMIIIALWCIQMNPNDRPSMNKVVEMLEGNVELLQMPPKPFLYPQEMPTEDPGVDTNPEEYSMIPSDDSTNSITSYINTI
ncbi:hypothetical protein F0562_015405 [Nyssa sinensis]|uniref:Protein kinase domain-containing protein n=1 Tax=Nyssa sinensis TaxID=561372 RepID=A0A5J4ZLA6_9ASTE|nr:hypothetical protein F0562_015405 [Nyssa sinensis]